MAQATTYPPVGAFLEGAYVDAAGTMEYRLFVPPGYDPNGSQEYPLVVFLHGQGETGSDNTEQLGGNAKGAMIFVASADPDHQTAHPCFFVAPQSPSGDWKSATNSPRVTGIVGQLQAQYRIDADRVYLTGLSMGGNGVWHNIQQYPGVFAAAVPICGYGQDTNQADALAPLPIWNFHAANDGTINVKNSDKMVAALRHAGGKPIYTRYATGGHGIWTTAYRTPGLVDWVMAQRRGQPMADPPAVCTITAPTANETFTASGTTLALSGTTAAGASAAGLADVTWHSDRFSATSNPPAVGSYNNQVAATGLASWTATVPIKTNAVNRIAVLVHGSSFSSLGGTTSYNDTIHVTYSAGGDTTPPSAPAGLAVTEAGADYLALAWQPATDNVGVVGYRVYEGGVEIGTAAGTSFVDEGLVPATTYTYTVKAEDAAGNLSAAGGPLSAATLAAVFLQDFDDNLPVASYVNPSVPSVGECTDISAETDGGMWSVTAGRLVLARPGTSTNGAGMTRIVQPGVEPQALAARFRISVTGINTYMDLALLDLGEVSSVGDYNSSTPSSQVANRLVVKGGGDGWVRFQINGANSSSFPADGSVMDVAWYANQSGSGVAYTGPDGSAQTVASGACDLWVNGVKLFDDAARSAVYGADTMGGFRFRVITNQPMTLGLDDVAIAPIP